MKLVTKCVRCGVAVAPPIYDVEVPPTVIDDVDVNGPCIHPETGEVVSHHPAIRVEQTILGDVRSGGVILIPSEDPSLNPIEDDDRGDLWRGTEDLDDEQ